MTYLRFCSHVQGLPRAESIALLDRLLSAMTSDEIQAALHHVWERFELGERADLVYAEYVAEGAEIDAEEAAAKLDD